MPRPSTSPRIRRKVARNPDMILARFCPPPGSDFVLPLGPGYTMPMSWRRFIVAVVCGAAVTPVVSLLYGRVVMYRIVGPLVAVLPPPWTGVVGIAMVALCLALPGIGFAVLIALHRRPDAETRCRHCNYILRGLSEPRCPECGERI